MTDMTEYEMKILQDDGNYRHLEFRVPGTIDGRYELITWPGHLCVAGNMGTYVFRRLPDMFEFFRGDKINPSYWAEKAEAVDVRGGTTKYLHDRAAIVVLDLVEDEDESNHPGLREAVRRFLTPWASDGETRFRDAVDSFEFDGFTFTDFWEVDLTGFTHHYLWCCEAIVQGIRMYDQSKR